MKKISRRAFVNNLSMGVGGITVATTLPSFLPFSYMKKETYKGRKLNIALCGLGRYANILAKGLEETEYCRLAGIITGTPSIGASWKAKYNIPDKNIYNYENFASILNNKDIDLVYVVLPNSMHKDYTIRAAKAGKHVIVEKPMALTAKDCREMIEACKNAGVQLAVGYRLHYEPNHQELMRLGQEKILGQVRLIEVSLGYSLEGIDPSDWHLKKTMSGGGPLMNLGVYCIQAGRYVLGEEPTSVTAQFGPVTKPELFSEVEESITWQLNFPGGTVCTSSSSYMTNIDRFYAATDEGFFELSPAVSYGPFRGRSNEKEFNFPVINQQAAQMDGISRLILNKRDLPGHINGEEGYKDMKVIEAIYEAANKSEKVVI